MKGVTNIELIQQKQLGILAECLRVFRAEGLRYYMIGGSSLGAIRHGGFIPWDDDIDIGMPRADYERFMTVHARSLREPYRLEAFQLNSSTPFHFSKVCDINTTFIQPLLAHLPLRHAIALDIFPLDGYPRRRYEQRIQRWGFSVLRRLLMMHLGVLRPNLKLVPVAFLHAAMECVMKRHPFDVQGLTVNWWGSWGAREVAEGAVFGEGRKVLFAGYEVTVPAKVEQYLTSLYGDYLSLPPIHMRRTHHETIKISIDQGLAINK